MTKRHLNTKTKIVFRELLHHLKCNGAVETAEEGVMGRLDARMSALLHSIEVGNKVESKKHFEVFLKELIPLLHCHSDRSPDFQIPAA